MARYFSATAPSGQIFVRSSENRIYLFMVVLEYNIETERQRAEKQARDRFNLNKEFHTEWVEGRSPHAVIPSYLTPEGLPAHQTEQWRQKRLIEHHERVATHVRESKEVLAKGVEGRVQEDLERFDLYLQKRPRSPDGRYYYTESGWCSRKDLADKLVAQVPSSAVRSIVIETKEIDVREYRKLKSAQ